MIDQPSDNVLDVAVVGAGPTGLAAALGFAQAGFKTACFGPRPAPDRIDRRTTALLEGSVHFLDDRLGVWRALAPLAEPLRSLQLIDRTGRLFRAPDIYFTADEIDADAFGHNLPNADLVRILIEALGDHFQPTAGIASLQTEESLIRLGLTEGQSVQARLVIGADGRQSLCRDHANIDVQRWSYGQTATVCNFRHSRPHRGACAEFHYPNGPFTVVPLPGAWSSLVWVEADETAKSLAARDDAEFAQSIAERLDGVLGDILEVGPRGAFPLSGLIANKLVSRRLALIGEAAHVMPPIGAQGLNLGFRDVADLLDRLSGAADPGSPDRLAAYDTRRRGDIWGRTMAADLLNRTLTSNVPLFQIARGAGLSALSLAAPLRRAAMRQGMSATSQ